jgi:predicted DNA-binding protein
MSAHVQIKLTDEQHKRLKIFCAEAEKTVGQVVKEALEAYLIPKEKEKENG